MAFNKNSDYSLSWNSFSRKSKTHFLEILHTFSERSLKKLSSILLCLPYHQKEQSDKIQWGSSLKLGDPHLAPGSRFSSRLSSRFDKLDNNYIIRRNKKNTKSYLTFLSQKWNLVIIKSVFCNFPNFQKNSKYI